MLRVAAVCLLSVALTSCATIGDQSSVERHAAIESPSLASADEVTAMAHELARAMAEQSDTIPSDAADIAQIMAALVTSLREEGNESLPEFEAAEAMDDFRESERAPEVSATSPTR